MKLTPFLAAAVAAALLVLGGCDLLGTPGHPQPDPAVVLMNPSAAADYDRFPASLKTYLEDLSKAAGISPAQQTRLSAIAFKYKDFPAAKTGDKKPPDFRPLFLADPLDVEALRGYFSHANVSQKEAVTRNAAMMTEMRDTLAPEQREQVAAFLLAHPDPLQGPPARKAQPPENPEVFGMMIDQLLEGVPLRADQAQRRDALKAAFLQKSPPRDPDFYLKKIVAFIRDGNSDAYLADVQAESAQDMPVNEILEAMACLDLAQRQQIAARFDELTRRFQPQKR